ncbi:selection and upkeep of intraepithelial T-cells protein 2 isoform X3 [Larimichthys crocea]|uniref:selection and upkeep of intraepithelial T-cells protein 2 isoform X3 n=1 Tax=Larimichthys crocea TaxID=215358 RepID=UPI000F5E955B|nr:selection and upkeep of intraepithelial T-cells protein 2 isoform X3 [Larimichthys crocea]
MKLTMLTALTLLLLPGSTRGDKPGVVKVFVQEDSDAILPCSPSTKESLVFKTFDWIKENDRQRDVFLYQSGVTKTGADKFKDRVSYFTDELKNGNASIIIGNAKMEDSGNYTCIFLYLVPRESFHVELVVEPVLKDRYGKIEGASSKPHIMRVNVTEDGVQLHCLVQGAFPKPEVEFQDSAGKVLPAEEPQVLESGQRYTVTLITTLTKTDDFRCVAKQKEILHETSAEIYVSVRDKHVDVTGWFVGFFFLGVFSLAAVQALLVRTKHIKIQFIKGPCQQTKSSGDFL